VLLPSARLCGKSAIVCDSDVLCVECTEYSIESIPYMLSAYVLCCLYLYVSLLYIRKNLTSVFLADPRNLLIVSSLTGRVKVTGVPS